MAYMIFERKTPRIGSPMLSFSNLGQLSLNQPAARILKERNVRVVLIMWDPDEHKLGLRSISNLKDPRGYVVRFNSKGSGASFSCKTFLDFAGIDYATRKAVPVEISVKGDIVLEVKLPESLFKNQEDIMETVVV